VTESWSKWSLPPSFSFYVQGIDPVWFRHALMGIEDFDLQVVIWTLAQASPRALFRTALVTVSSVVY
jgi:hypothetical protein